MKKILPLLMLASSMLLTSCNNFLVLLIQLTSEPAPDKTPVFSMDSIIGDEASLSIVLFDDKVYYFVGRDLEDGELINLQGNPSIGDVVLKMYGEQQDKFRLQIKECKSANPDNLDILMRRLTQVGIIRYALVEPTTQEQAYVETLQ